VSCSSFATIVVGPHAPAPAGELTPGSPIRCAALHATVPARCCLLRQQVARVQVTRDRHRGTSPDFPSCLRCAQGAALSAAIGTDDVWRGCGAGGRSQQIRTRRDRDAQERARERLERRGLLALVPSVDEPPGEPDESGFAAVAL
jgi:hypothetical protein